MKKMQKTKKDNMGPLKTKTFSYYPKIVRRNIVIIGLIAAFVAGAIVGKLWF